MKNIQRPIFDVIIVGSGMAGGAAAQQFCEAGLRVLVLEAGGTASKLAPDTQSLSVDKAYPVQARCYAFSANTRGYFAADIDNPYCTNPEHPFSWIRARTVGGRSLLWAGHCYRMGDVDFAAASQDGVGQDWPLRYEEIAADYDQAERLLQVCDAEAAFSSVPQLERTSNLTLSERRVLTARSKGLKTVPARISHAQTELGTPCIHCGSLSGACVRPVTSSGSTLASAFATGRLTLWTHAQVHTVLVNSSARATGVAGINAATREPFEAAARLVFVCASALESTRILLNSVSPLFPSGLGNSSGVLGHYLMDHISGIVVTAVFNNHGSAPSQNGRAGMFYIPRWQNLRRERNTFLRGYGYQGFIVRSDHDLLPCGRTNKNQFMEDNDFDNRVAVRLVAFGEMLPNHKNRVEIDKAGTKDALGIPVLRIDCRLGENETAMVPDMVSSAVDYLESAGGQITEIKNVPREPGLAIHEAGTCRMGNDSSTSVLNRFNQSHDVPNLFVTDASSFPSIGIQNPVLTILALTIRACRYAIEQLRLGAI